MTKFIDKSFTEELQSKGYFRFSDATPTITPNNIGAPAGLLSQLSRQAVENILTARRAEQIIGGRTKLLDWAEQNVYIPFIERTGQTEAYGDFNQPTTSGLNASFNNFNHYRFSAMVQVGNLLQEQYAKLGMNAEVEVQNAATEALAVELNRTAIYGYVSNSSTQFLTYGLLNNPDLDPFVNSNTTFENMTWQEVVAFFAKAISELNKKTGGNVDSQSKIRVALASSTMAFLSKFTDIGIPIFEQIQKLYPNMEFIPAPELEKANNNQNVIYFIAENGLGGVNKTMDLGFSEMARFSVKEFHHNHTSQVISTGTIGCVVYKPAFVLRYTNI